MSNHWSPYWYNCGLCLPELRPHYILHMDKLGKNRPGESQERISFSLFLESDSMKLLSELGLGHLELSYPHTMKGLDGHSSDHNLHYYSKLSKKQVSGMSW